MSLIAAAYSAALGVLIVLIAWLPLVLRRLPLSLPIICVIIGAAVGTLIPQAPASIFYNSPLAEHVAEGTLVMALLGSGLKVDRKFSLHGWMTTWRLLGLGMPLTIVAVAAVAYWLGGWPIATALLFGAALVPTDPVLASAVSVGPPGSGEEGEIRFGLTTEAALNDGLAFPFVALAMLLASNGQVTAGWVAHYFLMDVIAGLAVGWLFGRFFGWILFRFPLARLSDAGDGIVAIGLAMIVFAACEVAGLNGFLGVVAMAFGVRTAAPEAEFHRNMTDFTGQIERLFTYLLLVGFGATIGHGLLNGLRWQDAAIGLLLVFVLRPVIGWLCLIGSPHPFISRALTAFFGIRGIGTLYYMLYALHSGAFNHAGEIAATIAFTILCSILVHGAASRPLMNRADAARKRSIEERRQDRQREEEQRDEPPSGKGKPEPSSPSP